MLGHKLKNGKIKFVRENFKELFVYKLSLRALVSEGVRVPLFYLPCRRDPVSSSLECWLFILAPFVIAFYLIQQMFRSLWKDITYLYEDLKMYNSRKREIDVPENDSSYREDSTPDNYPVRSGFLYLVNGAPLKSPLDGTVLDLKEWYCQASGLQLNDIDVRKCDIRKRGLQKYTL